MLFLMFIVTISAEGKSNNNTLSYPITKTIRYLKNVNGINYISWKQAHYQAHIIEKYANQYRINWKTIVAITFVESSFDQFLGKILEWGPMQISKDVWSRGCKHLEKTIDGGYKCGVRHLMKMKWRYWDKPDTWYGYFNSSTPKYLSRYLLKIDYQLEKIDTFIARSISDAVLYL